MSLRSGKTLVEMVRPRNNPFPQNNAPENEQPISLTIGTTENINPIGTNETVIDPVVSTTLMPRAMIVLPASTSTPTTPRPTSIPLLDPRPSYI